MSLSSEDKRDIALIVLWVIVIALSLAFYALITWAAWHFVGWWLGTIVGLLVGVKIVMAVIATIMPKD